MKRSPFIRERREIMGGKRRRKNGKDEKKRDETTSLAALSALAIMPTAFISAYAFSGIFFSFC